MNRPWIEYETIRVRSKKLSGNETVRVRNVQGMNCLVLKSLNPGRFGPIPVRSGRFGPGRFGPISRVGRFGPVGAGRFGPIS